VRSRGGRPTKLTDNLTDQVVELLEAGVPRETAALALGLGASTFYDWMRRGDPSGTAKKDSSHREFRERVEQACREGERRLVEKIAGDSDWRAQAWLLARLNPDRFAGRSGRPKDALHPGDFAAGETSSPQDVIDDQVGPDGSPL
jgi:hypothetical protein